MISLVDLLRAQLGCYGMRVVSFVIVACEGNCVFQR